MPRAILLSSKKKPEHRCDLPMNGDDHFEYVMHDGALFVKLEPCDRHDEQGRIFAYVQNPFVEI